MSTTTTTTTTTTTKTNVTLISSDEKKITIPVEAAMLSILLVNSLNLDEEEEEDNDNNNNNDDSKNDEEEQPFVVNMLKVDYDTLVIITKFLVYACDYPLSINKELLEDTEYFIKEKFEDNIDDKFYVDYMNTMGEDMDVLYKVKDAANYMEIQSLLELICMYLVGELEKCHSTVECMKLLRISDFANELEEENYRKNAGWMFRFPPQQTVRAAAGAALSAAAGAALSAAATVVSTEASTTAASTASNTDDITDTTSNSTSLESH